MDEDVHDSGLAWAVNACPIYLKPSVISDVVYCFHTLAKFLYWSHFAVLNTVLWDEIYLGRTTSSFYLYVGWDIYSFFKKFYWLGMHFEIVNKISTSQMFSEKLEKYFSHSGNAFFLLSKLSYTCSLCEVFNRNISVLSWFIVLWGVFATLRS
jgi:hypothetical protein